MLRLSATLQERLPLERKHDTRTLQKRLDSFRKQPRHPNAHDLGFRTAGPAGVTGWLSLKGDRTKHRRGMQWVDSFLKFPHT